LTVLDFALSCKVKDENLGLEIFFFFLKSTRFAFFAKKKHFHKYWTFGGKEKMEKNLFQKDTNLD